MMYNNYKKYKKKYKQLQIGSGVSQTIPSIIYKTLLLSRFCYEPPVFFLIAIGLSRQIFNNLPDKIDLLNLANTSKQVNSLLKDVDKEIIAKSKSEKTKLRKEYYDPQVIPAPLYSKINDQFAFIYLTTNADLNCYILADKRHGKIYIIFRGSQSIRNVMTDLNMKQVDLCQKKSKKDQLKVFQGFLSLEKKIINTIIFSCYNLAKDFIEKKVELVVTGHSLGAALACLFSYSYIFIIKNLPKLHGFLPNRVICTSFGAPKLFNKQLSNDFYEKIQENKIQFYRCVTRGDPITILPKVVYYHPGFNEKIGKYDPKNVFYFNCAGKMGGMSVNYNLPMDLKHNMTNTEGIYHLKNSHVAHVNYLYISFFGAIKHLHSFGQIMSYNKRVVIKLIIYSKDKAKSFEYIDDPFGNIPDYRDFSRLVLKSLSEKTLLDKGVSENMKELSMTYRELGNKGEIETILDPKTNLSIDEINNKFYNFRKLIC